MDGKTWIKAKKFLKCLYVFQNSSQWKNKCKILCKTSYIRVNLQNHLFKTVMLTGVNVYKFAAMIYLFGHYSPFQN